MTSIRWLGSRAAVTVVALASVAALAQATVNLLVAAYANVAPYTGS